MILFVGRPLFAFFFLTQVSWDWGWSSKKDRMECTNAIILTASMYALHVLLRCGSSRITWIDVAAEMIQMREFVFSDNVTI